MAKRRIDADVMRFTQRDGYLLRWIGEQFAVRYDQVGELIKRYTFETTGKMVGDETVRRLVDRFRKGGWVEKHKFQDGLPHWVFLTKRGIQVVGLTHPYRVPSLDQLNHFYHINMVRLYLEKMYSEDASMQWVSENGIIARRVAGGDYSHNHKAAVKTHRADGELYITEDGERVRVAIEVELTQKERSRINLIIAELINEYDQVWYFVTDRAKGMVKTVMNDPSYDTVRKGRMRVIAIDKL